MTKLEREILLHNAKLIIEAGSKQVGIELPMYKVEWDDNYPGDLPNAVAQRNPSDCWLWGVKYSSVGIGLNFGKSIRMALPTSLAGSKEVSFTDVSEEIFGRPWFFDMEEAAKEVYNLEDTATPSGSRVFESGANRNSDEGKLDFEGFLSPTVLKAYGEYMHKNRLLEDGTLRDSDNWQKGIPVDAYMKSMYRHFFDVWSMHRGIQTEEDQITNLCAVMFNSMGMLHELLKKQSVE